MRILRSAYYREMPWKNGGGTTTEIAVSPPGAATDGFDWRISMASVQSDGWFSEFPQVDRTLSILQGNGILLSISGGAEVQICQASEPFHFPADAPALCEIKQRPRHRSQCHDKANAFYPSRDSVDNIQSHGVGVDGRYHRIPGDLSFFADRGRHRYGPHRATGYCDF